ncbi:MAG: ABC transporter ATP-binding protein [Bacilli bacterium]
MLRIFKYLKNSIVSILIIIVLLVAQANLDLALPDYTSKIINVGIQQGGIENSNSLVLTEDTFNKVKLFMNEKEIKKLENSYTLIKKNDKKYIKDYSILKKENLYVLKEKAKVDSILTKPMMLLFTLSKAEQGSFFANVKYLNPQEVDKIVEEVNKKFDAMPASSVNGTAVLQVKEEYKKAGIDLNNLQINYIVVAGLKMLAIAFGIMAIALMIVFFGSRLAARLAKTLRSKVYKNVVNFSKNEMKTFGTSSLITRTTNDIQQIQQIVVMLMRVVFYAPIIAIGGILKMTNADNSMLWIVVTAVITLFIIMGTLFIIVMSKFKSLQELVDKLNQVTREILNGIPVIRAFANEKHEEERFDKTNDNLKKVSLFVDRTMSLMMPLMMLLMNVVCIAIVYYGAKGIDQGSIQVGDMLAYIQYSMQIIMSFLMISMMSIMLPRASICAKRVMEVIDSKSTVIDPIKEKRMDKSNKVEFKNVCFRYPDAQEDVLTDVNFTALEGTTTAFIGSTGSGKSTLINLLPRFYDVTEGSITINGTDIRDIKLNNLRNRLGYVPQKGILFSGTVSDNIKYSDSKVSFNDMEKAATISQSIEFINNLENKYESAISQGGTNVSGGQRQRLSIARAIASNPDIFIFDDSFSALDFKTDAKLRTELKKITKNKIVFIVAQRVSTIMNSEQIVVLNEGKVAGVGTHKELLKNCPVYKEIALSQLSEEELNNE